jgi:hypothetical protein
VLSMAGLVIERHTLAAISITGLICDGIGGLYLAYDLLGGKYGPLRILTRTVTYTLFFVLGYALFLGLVFGLVAGIGLGLVLGIEYGRHDISHHRLQWFPLVLGFVRGILLGLAAALAFGWLFGIIFGLLTGCGLVATYALGFSPTASYPESGQPYLRRRPFIASALRGISTGLAGTIAGLALERSAAALLLGLKVGFTVGVVSAVISLISPLIERWADGLPARRLGAFGTMLLLIGLVLQSVQYLVTIFDVTVR